jgi:hypothetical protein
LAQHSRDLKVLNVAMTKMLGANKFCTCEPYLEGEEVFGFQRRKVDIPLGSEYKSHRRYLINYSCPQVRIRSTGALDAGCNLDGKPEENSLNLQNEKVLPKAPNERVILDNTYRTCHVTAI